MCETSNKFEPFLEKLLSEKNHEKSEKSEKKNRCKNVYKPK